MGLVEESEQKQAPIVIKHNCRVCNRGFGCAGALGGHMRTHGAGGESRFRLLSPPPTNNNVEKEIIMSDIVTRSKAESSSSKQHSYFLRTNSNHRIISTHRFVGGGGDEDTTHNDDDDDRGKCRLLDEGGLLSRPPYPSSSESIGDGIIMKFKNNAAAAAAEREQSFSASREEEDLANCLVMLSNKCFINKEDNNNNNKVIGGGNNKDTDKGISSTMFQCKACKKYFSSHQALGGHRASHKKVKGCFAAKNTTNLNEDDSNEDDLHLINQDEILQGLSYSSSADPRGFDHHLHHQVLRQNRVTKSKSKDHQCSICQRVFTSGQALGGHKRCHWLTSNNLPDTTLIQNLRDQFQFDTPPTPHMFKKPIPLVETERKIDLNVTPQNTNPLSRYETTPGGILLKLWGNESNDQVVMKQDGGKVQETLHGNCSDNGEEEGEEVVEEEECRIKKVKLNELKDVNLDGGSSRWLQMGIASTTDM